MSDDDIPDLEVPFSSNFDVMLDKQKLPIGDPQKQFSEDHVEVALTNRQTAMKIYKDNPTEALLLLSDCVEMYPNSALYLNSRAEVFKYHGDLKLAERDLNLVVQRNPGNVPFKTHRLLAELMFDREDFDNCIAECKKALAVDNSDEVSSMLKNATQRQKQ